METMESVLLLADEVKSTKIGYEYSFAAHDTTEEWVREMLDSRCSSMGSTDPMHDTWDGERAACSQ